MTCARVEDTLAEYFGRDRISSQVLDGVTTLRCAPLKDEPSILVVVNGGDDLTVRLGRFASDDDWAGAIGALVQSRVVDIHRVEQGIHCFVLAGVGGTAAFYTIDDAIVADADTERWLRVLQGLGDEPSGGMR